MPSNQQRREAAKRKLQRQLVRREQARARRRRTTLIAGTVAVVVIAAGVVWLVASSNSTPSAADADGTATTGTADGSGSGTAATSTGPSTPCTYTAGGTAARDVKPPDNTSPANKGKVKATIDLNGETVDVTLDRSLAPCSVNSFLSLASQGFYDDTTCHRLTKSPALNVLQCGDPSGKGNGGPGYTYDAKPPADAKYPVGTLAMANTGTSGEGSQFFIVYGPTKITADYSVIGTVSKSGMKVVDAVADKGVQDDRQDGKPVAKAKIGSITVPDAAVTASTSWATSTAATGTAAAGSGASSSAGAGNGAATTAPTTNK